jgi:hypothetical protein
MDVVWGEMLATTLVQMLVEMLAMVLELLL